MNLLHRSLACRAHNFIFIGIDLPIGLGIVGSHTSGILSLAILGRHEHVREDEFTLLDVFTMIPFIEETYTTDVFVLGTCGIREYL
jgi:hypothetical protein